MSRSGFICATWATGFAPYLLAAGQASVHEAVTGAFVAVGATVFTCLLSGMSARRFCWSVSAFRPAVAALANLPKGTGRTAVALWRAVTTDGTQARSPAVPFDYGPENGEKARTRRALAVLLATLAPDRFVVTLASGKGQALLHAIVPLDHPVDRRWLA
jgi:hypothetical protein